MNNLRVRKIAFTAVLPTFPRGIKETSWSIKSKRDFFNREIYG